MIAFFYFRLEVARGLNKSRLAAAPEELWTVVEASQIILLFQTKSIISSGWSRSLLNKVGNLWFRFLALIGQIQVTSIPPRDLAVPEYPIHLNDHIAIIFIALGEIGQPILLSEMMKLLLDGSIPYLNTHRYLPAHFKPIKALPSSYRSVHLPQIASIRSRLLDVLDIFQIPHTSPTMKSIVSIANRIGKQYEIHDINFAAFIIDIVSRSKDNGDPTSLNFNFCVATFLAIRLYFQFEIPNSDKNQWLAWLQNYLKISETTVAQNLEANPSRPPNAEKYYSSRSVESYLNIADSILPHYRSVQNTGGDFDDLSKLFLSMPHKDDRNVRSEPLKPIRRRGMLINFPSLNTLPLELKLILSDLSAKFFIPEQTIFYKVVHILRSFHTVEGKKRYVLWNY